MVNGDARARDAELLGKRTDCRFREGMRLDRVEMHGA